MLTEEETKLLSDSRYAIRWLVSRTHISRSDFSVAKELYHRFSEHGSHHSRELKKALIKFALECHHENQYLYDFVMR